MLQYLNMKKTNKSIIKRKLNALESLANSEGWIIKIEGDTFVCKKRYKKTIINWDRIILVTIVLIYFTYNLLYNVYSSQRKMIFT